MLTVAVPVSEAERIQAFQERTRSKVRDLDCPVHHQAPRVEFHGGSLRDMTISMRGCCSRLIQIANKAIAS